MKKTLILLFLFTMTAGVNAQKFITKNGHIGFYSHTPLEDIIADNNQVASILDISNKQIVFQALMKSFIFKKALMQEHFNENYVESEKYPKATFEGTVVSPDGLDLSKDGEYKVMVEGKLTLHGVTKQVKEPGMIKVNGNVITADSEFTLIPGDFDIEIPGVVRDKIAKEITVKVEMKYNAMK